MNATPGTMPRDPPVTSATFPLRIFDMVLPSLDFRGSQVDWDVLAALTADRSGSQRVGDLANTLGWDRSRLSRHAARMQKRGLVERVECPEDGRAATYHLTEAGWQASRAAAPRHVETVRRLFLEPLARPTSPA
jgi:DNA-binding MarR family transcriptional regulator